MSSTYLDRFAGSVVADLGKQPCDAATIGPITLAGYQTVDGVALTSDYMRCLVKNQSDQTTNGIYVVFSGGWIRAGDFSGPSGTVSGQLVVVTNGSQQGVWILKTPNPVQIDRSGGQTGNPSNIIFVPGPSLTGYVTSYGFNNIIVSPQVAPAANPTGLAVSLPGGQAVLNNVLMAFPAINTTLLDNAVYDYWLNQDGSISVYNSIQSPSQPRLTPASVHLWQVFTSLGRIISIVLMTNTYPTIRRNDDVGITFDNLLENLYINPVTTDWAANTPVGYGALLKTAAGDVYQVFLPGTTGSTAPTAHVGVPPNGDIPDGTARLFYYCQDFYLGAFRYAPGNGIVMYFVNGAIQSLIQRTALTGSPISVPAGTTMASLAKTYILNQFQQLVCNRVNSGTYKRGMKMIAGGYIWACTTAGTAASSSPYSGTYTPYTSNVTDGTAVFQCIHASYASQQFFWMDVDQTFLVYRTPDSHDSYASTFIALIARYVQLTGDSGFIFGVSPQPSGSGTYYSYQTLFENIFTYNLLNQMANFLTYTFQGAISPSDGSVYNIQFLEDNVESYVGYVAAAYLFGVWGDTIRQGYAVTNAAYVASGVAGLYDTTYNLFATLYGESVTVWKDQPNKPWYPRLQSQFFPEFFNVPTIDQDSRNSVRAYVGAQFPGWWLDKGKDSFPQNSFGVLAARNWQDPAKAMAFIENTDRYFATGGGLIIGEFADYLTIKDLLVNPLRVLQNLGTSLTVSDNQDNLTTVSADGTLVHQNAAAAFTVVLPANAYITNIFIVNTAGFSISGGLDVGTTLAGADIISALAVGANSIQMVHEAALLKRVFSTSAPTTLYFGPHTAWNSANVTVKVRYSTL